MAEASGSLPKFQTLLGRFQRLLASELGEDLVSLALYGSVARGTATAESDIDLLVVVSDDAPQAQERVTRAQLRLEGEPEYASLRREGLWPLVSCLVLSRREAQEPRWVFLDMAEDAVILEDKAGFFARRLERLRGRLRELGSRKVVLPDKSWYWNLKPDLRPGEAFEL